MFLPKKTLIHADDAAVLNQRDPPGGDRTVLMVVVTDHRKLAPVRSLRLGVIHLDQLLKLEAQTGADSAPGATQEFTAVQNLATGPQDKQSQAVTMLEAHEAVVEANPENEAKFKDVLEFLRQNVEEGE